MHNFPVGGALSIFSKRFCAPFFLFFILMKSLATFLFSLSLLVALTACSGEEPMTEAEQAESMGMTMEEYQETKEAAARMNMSVEEHMNMGH